VTVAARPSGRIVESLILRFGEMPPAAGPARAQWCVSRGLTALADARKKHGIALRAVMAHLPHGPSDLPRQYPLHSLHPELLALVVGRARVRSWFALRRQLDHIDGVARRNGLVMLGTAWEAAEQCGRAAVQAAADGFNWLDDAHKDLGGETRVDVASFIGRPADPQPVGALVDAAHATAHAAGELVGGLFGCRMVHDREQWNDRCTLALLHLRFGNSAGLAVRYECSVCRQDPGDCEHEPGAIYTVRAARTANGECTVCGVSDCNVHPPGTAHQVTTRAVLSDPRLREVSITPRPRDPLTRITSRPVEDEDIRARLGRLPDPDEEILSHACMYPCTGFIELPEL